MERAGHGDEFYRRVLGCLLPADHHPGADWAYTISAGIHGQRVLPAVIGLMSGHLLAAIIVIAGIGVAVTGHPLVLSLITLLGAAYLLWLGIAILRHPPRLAPQHSRPEAGTVGR